MVLPGEADAVRSWEALAEDDVVCDRVEVAGADVCLACDAKAS